MQKQLGEEGKIKTAEKSRKRNKDGSGLKKENSISKSEKKNLKKKKFWENEIRQQFRIKQNYYLNR